MNFILHFRGWLRWVARDERLTPHHISLYVALFETWNANHFQNPVTIYRSEMMRLSKIGSLTTYLKCLRELSAWQYIRYMASHNPQQGSKVHLYRMDTTTDTTTGTTDDTTGDTTPGTTGGTTPATLYKIIPNSENSINPKNNINADGTSLEHSDFVDGDTNHPPAQGIHSKSKDAGQATPRNLEEAEAYFAGIHSTAAEAAKFFNHYQSNGWRVGGRAPMKDWRAAARNWMINAKKFNHEHTSQPKPGKLNTGPKNYAEPL